MGNFIATLILLVITFLVLNLFPFFREWTSNLRDQVDEKATNVTEEYERVKDKVNEITGTVVETKEKVEDTVDAVGEAVSATGRAIDQVNSALKGGGETVPENTGDEPSEEESVEEPGDASADPQGTEPEEL
jgi:ABC-type transporter Mla subunit MlaD